MHQLVLKFPFACTREWDEFRFLTQWQPSYGDHPCMEMVHYLSHYSQDEANDQEN